MTKRINLELLAPAKDLNCGKEAILHGADAVYIGAPRFGARSAVGNRIEDIAELAGFAHRYGARVYVALNTLLRDDELMEAERIIKDLWKYGADALIVQDMGITRLDLPPIPLHASTQTDNRTVDKVRFLQDAGFKQIVLARELGLQQISEIASQTDVNLECFVHGALCVSYSGQCYLSQVLTGRSANRGECAQCCRLPYDLVDGTGQTLMKQKHVLSIRDLNRSESLEALVEAGVRSFKIEGRLKDVTYVKNVTAWYRMQLDALLERHPEWARTSLGLSRFTFSPDPAKSFNRQYTDYFLNERPEELWNPDTPKSMGEPVGSVRMVKANAVVVDSSATFSNGDGLSFFNEQGVFDGFRVNRAEGRTLLPARMPSIRPGTPLYRTNDQAFETLLSKPSAIRLVQTSVECVETHFGFALTMKTINGHTASVTFECEKVPAGKPQKDAVRTVLTKLGNTMYEATSCRIDWKGDWFVPVSIWTEQRRRLVELMDKVLSMAFRREEHRWKPTSHPYPEESLGYLGNILNKEASAFYTDHGTTVLEPALESGTNRVSETDAESWSDGSVSNEEFKTTGLSGDLPLMFCKHCIKFSLGACPRKKEPRKALAEPLCLISNGRRLLLEFDCKACLMKVSAG